MCHLIKIQIGSSFPEMEFTVTLFTGIFGYIVWSWVRILRKFITWCWKKWLSGIYFVCSDEEKATLKNGSISVKPRPIFPRCIFIRCILNKEIHDAIRECEGVGGFMVQNLETHECSWTPILTHTLSLSLCVWIDLYLHSLQQDTD